MSNTTITPNMGLVVPTVGEDPGPDWANNINADLGVLDQHNHSNGQGVPITPSGLNINADLPLNNNNITLINSLQYTSLLSPLPGSAPFLNATYFANGNFYVNDGTGNQVKITSGGTVNATSSGISSGTATAAFSGGVLVVDSNVNTPANIQGGSVLIGNNVANSNYMTFQAPNSLAANYSVTGPPTNSTGGTAFLTYDASNNMGVGPAVTGGIAQANLAPRATGTTVPAGGVAKSVSSGSFSSSSGSLTTVVSCTITTTGRPVFVGLMDAGSGSVLEFNTSSNSAGSSLAIFNGSTLISDSTFSTPGGSGGQSPVIPPGAVWVIDFPAAGTYTYSFQVAVTGSGTVLVLGCSLMAYEI